MKESRKRQRFEIESDPCSNKKSCNTNNSSSTALKFQQSYGDEVDPLAIGLDVPAASFSRCYRIPDSSSVTAEVTVVENSAVKHNDDVLSKDLTKVLKGKVLRSLREIQDDILEVVTAVLSGEDKIDRKQQTRTIVFTLEHDIGEFRMMVERNGAPMEEVITVCYDSDSDGGETSQVVLSSKVEADVGKFCIPWFYRCIWKKCFARLPAKTASGLESAIFYSSLSKHHSYQLLSGEWSSETAPGNEFKPI